MQEKELGPLSYVSYTMLCSRPWDACPFLKETGGGVDGKRVDGRRGREWEGWRERKPLSVCKINEK